MYNLLDRARRRIAALLSEPPRDPMRAWGMFWLLMLLAIFVFMTSLPAMVYERLKAVLGVRE